MILQIVKVGNSKGLRIPKSILEQYHIEDEVDVTSTKDGLLLKPIKSKARAGWAKKFKEMATNRDDRLLMPDFTDAADRDWQW
ncbi:AbrB/MazE/SpoVT family DNA-binding domain-containing protein [Turneriella parva]|uniref:SpoVT/AbrB domain-containing protein n=1 Tax=Turneriella parva (strain ATCC BAA-1111 / DSM 21527 / NCTC 11395 / H) TaxID=869212 RepID=I4B5V9_TURPD|nr:AbrB/MazE/SpoVT family DNA-binding domain-containing protein [Turneriella parva]AFM12666.1 SpoVT/AbrB domain-containing protein [Turneriella parva DSM 21527]